MQSIRSAFRYFRGTTLTEKQEPLLQPTQTATSAAAIQRSFRQANRQTVARTNPGLNVQSVCSDPVCSSRESFVDYEEDKEAALAAAPCSEQIDTQSRPAQSAQVSIEMREAIEDERGPQPYTKKRKCLTGASISAVIADLFFPILLYITDVTLGEGKFDLASGSWGFILYCVMALWFALNNAVSNTLSILPVDVVAPKQKKPKPAKKPINKGKKYFAGFNQVVAMIPYTVVSASNAVVLAYLTDNTLAHYVMGIPATLLGVYYCRLLTAGTIDDHSDGFVETLPHLHKSILAGLKSPFQTLEVGKQVLANAANRAVTYADITYTLIQQLLFHTVINRGSIPFYLMITVGGLTVYSTFLSKYLKVYGKAFPKAAISAESFQRAWESKLGWTGDFLMSSMMSVPASILLFRFGFENAWLNGPAIGATFSLLTWQGLSVGYQRRALNNELALLLKRKLAMSPDDANKLSTEELFELIQEELKTPLLNAAMTEINVSARLSRSLSFLGFLVGVQGVVKKQTGIALDWTTTLCIFFLWNTPSMLNDLAFFAELLPQNYCHYKLQVAMEEHKPTYGWGAFWLSKDEYRKSELLDLLAKVRQDKAITKPESNVMDLPYHELPYRPAFGAI